MRYLERMYHCIMRQIDELSGEKPEKVKKPLLHRNMFLHLYFLMLKQ